MNEQFIKRVSIDWNKVDEHSYLREIKTLKLLREIEFNKAITIFAGENGSGKSTVLEAIAISYGFNPEGGTKNYFFQRMTLIRRCIKLFRSLEDIEKLNGDISLGLKVFIMWLLRKRNIPILHIPQKNIIKNRMEKAL